VVIDHQRFAVDAESPLNAGFRRPVQNLSTDQSFRAHVALPDVRICVEAQDSHPPLAFLSRRSWVRSPPPSPLSTFSGTPRWTILSPGPAPVFICPLRPMIACSPGVLMDRVSLSDRSCRGPSSPPCALRGSGRRVHKRAPGWTFSPGLPYVPGHEPRPCACDRFRPGDVGSFARQNPARTRSDPLGAGTRKAPSQLTVAPGPPRLYF
jgi:hypothetical protein